MEHCLVSVSNFIAEVTKMSLEEVEKLYQDGYQTNFIAEVTKMSLEEVEKRINHDQDT
jgi:hypothetical protein